MPQKSRAIWVLVILALLAIFVGAAGLAGLLDVPLATPKGVNAANWAILLMEISWGLIVGGALTLVGICCVWFVRSLDKVKQSVSDTKPVDND